MASEAPDRRATNLSISSVSVCHSDHADNEATESDISSFISVLNEFLERWNAPSPRPAPFPECAANSLEDVPCESYLHGPYFDYHASDEAAESDISSFISVLDGFIERWDAPSPRPALLPRRCTGTLEDDTPRESSLHGLYFDHSVRRRSIHGLGPGVSENLYSSYDSLSWLPLEFMTDTESRTHADFVRGLCRSVGGLRGEGDVASTCDETQPLNAANICLEQNKGCSVLKRAHSNSCNVKCAPGIEDCHQESWQSNVEHGSPITIDSSESEESFNVHGCERAAESFFAIPYKECGTSTYVAACNFGTGCFPDEPQQSGASTSFVNQKTQHCFRNSDINTDAEGAEPLSPVDVRLEDPVDEPTVKMTFDIHRKFSACHETHLEDLHITWEADNNSFLLPNICSKNGERLRQTKLGVSVNQLAHVSEIGEDDISATIVTISESMPLPSANACVLQEVFQYADKQNTETPAHLDKGKSCIFVHEGRSSERLSRTSGDCALLDVFNDGSGFIEIQPELMERHLQALSDIDKLAELVDSTEDELQHNDTLSSSFNNSICDKNTSINCSQSRLSLSEYGASALGDVFQGTEFQDFGTPATAADDKHDIFHEDRPPKRPPPFKQYILTSPYVFKYADLQDARTCAATDEAELETPLCGAESLRRSKSPIPNACALLDVRVDENLCNETESDIFASHFEHVSLVDKAAEPSASVEGQVQRDKTLRPSVREDICEKRLPMTSESTSLPTADTCVLPDGLADADSEGARLAAAAEKDEPEIFFCQANSPKRSTPPNADICALLDVCDDDYLFNDMESVLFGLHLEHMSDIDKLANPIVPAEDLLQHSEILSSDADDEIGRDTTAIIKLPTTLTASSSNESERPLRPDLKEITGKVDLFTALRHCAGSDCSSMTRPPSSPNSWYQLEDGEITGSEHHSGSPTHPPRFSRSSSTESSCSAYSPGSFRPLSPFTLTSLSEGETCDSEECSESPPYPHIYTGRTRLDQPILPLSSMLYLQVASDSQEEEGFRNECQVLFDDIFAKIRQKPLLSNESQELSSKMPSIATGNTGPENNVYLGKQPQASSTEPLNALSQLKKQGIERDVNSKSLECEERCKPIRNGCKSTSISEPQEDITESNQCPSLMCPKSPDVVRPPRSYRKRRTSSVSSSYDSGNNLRLHTDVSVKNSRRKRELVSDSSSYSFKRPCLVTDIYDIKIKKAEKVKERKIMKAEARLKRGLRRIHEAVKRGERKRSSQEGRGLSQRRTSAPPRDLLMRERRVHREFTCKVRHIRNTYKVTMDKLVAARDEVLHFNSFYSGLQDKDPMLLTDGQVSDYLKIEAMLKLYKKVYKVT